MGNQNDYLQPSPLQQSNIKPQTAPEQKRHSFLNNKLFLITLTFVILATFIYAGIYLNLNSQLDQIAKRSQTLQITPSLPSPTSVYPTENWKTYRNGEYKFEFKYPNNLFLGGVQEFNQNAGTDIKLHFWLTKENCKNVKIEEAEICGINDNLNFNIRNAYIYSLKDWVDVNLLSKSNIIKFQNGGGYADGGNYCYESAKQGLTVIDNVYAVTYMFSGNQFTHPGKCA